MQRLSLQSDVIGMFASLLCVVHCLATPLLFIAKVCSTACCADTPVWWQAVDYVFAGISGVAVYYSTRNTTSKWISPTFWLLWALLLIVIFNTTLGIYSVPQTVSYIPALLIVALHFYNYKYCCTQKMC